MSANGRRKRNKRKNKNQDPSKDELYDDFLSMFGKSVDPIEIFKVLERNEWNAESSVDELMNMPQESEPGRPSSKSVSSLYEEDSAYLALSSNPQKSFQNLNFSPHSSNNDKSNVKQFNGFHDVKVVYKGENLEDEADADIIIEEEDVYNEQVPNDSPQFILNACASRSSNLLVSTSTRASNPKTLNSDYEKFNIDNIAFQKNVATHKYAPSTSASNIIEIKPPIELESTSINVIYYECLKIVDSVDRINSLVLNSIKVMVLLRGCPGSGKSFIANKIILNQNNISPHMKLKSKDHILSTDDYFMSPKHGYRFDGRMLPQAHDWNSKRALKAVSGNVNPVVIDNTNTQIWEMAPYVQIGVEFGYVVEVLEPETKWKFNEYELFRRNIHGVPRANIRSMLERYEHGITRNNILQMLKCQYHPSKQPPQIVPGQKMNALKDIVPKPSEFNGWPTSTFNYSNSSRSVSSSDGKNMEKTCQPNHFLENNFTNKDNNYSNLTPSCRTFFEKSLLSSVAGREATTDDSKVFPVVNNDTLTEEIIVGKNSKEHNDRSRSVSRNALLSNMIKDCQIPDLIAKTPNLSSSCLTKPSIKDDKLANPVRTNVDLGVSDLGNLLIDFGDSKKLDSTSSLEDESDTTEDELSELASNISKLTVDMSKQLHLMSVCSSDSTEESEDNASKRAMLPALKDSLNIKDSSSTLEAHIITSIENLKCDPSNLDEKVSDSASANSCLMDEACPTSHQNINLISCISITDLSSKVQKNAVIAQLSNNSTSQFKESIEPVHDSKLSCCKDDCLNNVETCQESTQQCKTVTPTEIKEEKCDDSTVLKEFYEELNSTIDERIELSSVIKELHLENNEENSETSNQETPSVCGNEFNIVSNANVMKELPCESVSNEQAKISNIDMKEFKFKPTKQVTGNNSGVNNKDLFFSELKDDPVDDYFNDSEISELLQSLEDLDLKFISDEESDSFKRRDNEVDKLDPLKGIEPSSSHSTEAENHSTVPPNNTAIPISGCNNICKPIDVESVKTFERDKLNSISSITIFPESNLELANCTTDKSDELKKNSSINVLSESNLVVPFTTFDESDEFNTSSSMRILSDSYMTVAEDSNSDSLYFDVDNVDIEVSEPTNIDNDDDEGVSNRNHEGVSLEDEDNNVSSNEILNKKEKEDMKEGKNVESNEVLNNKEKEEINEEKNVDFNEVLNNKELGEAISQIPVIDKEYTDKNAADNSLEVVNSKEEDDGDELENIVETVSQRLVIEKESIDENVDEENDDCNQLLNSKQKEGVKNVESRSVADEPVHIQKQSNISIDGVRALIKEGAAVKTFDVMSWLKNNFIKESGEGSSDIERILSDTTPEETQTIENVTDDETAVGDDSGESNSQCLNSVSKISDEEPQLKNESKPPRNVERTGPVQQNYSIIDSSQSNNEGYRKRNTFLVWDSVNEPENSWAEKMKNALGTIDGEDDHIPKPQRENHKQPGNSGLEGERSFSGHESAATKVIDILSCDVEQPDEQKSETESFGQKLQVLSNLFPDSQSIYVEEILRQCRGDVNWAAGLLLEGGCEISAKSYCSKTDVAPELVEISRKSADEGLTQPIGFKSSKKQKREKKNANNNMSEARMELKKMIEQNFVLSENSYSEHLLKLLKFRRGEINLEYEAEAEVTDTYDCYDPELMFPDDVSHPAVEEQFQQFERTECFDQENAEGAPEDEETLEFVFNKDVITTLSYNFGSAGFPLDMTNVNCPVKLPMRLARELHSYWMDSVEEYLSNENSRMQMMIKEDEELAIKLHQEEACAINPNLQEVIDFETALMLHEADVKKTREVSGNDSTVAAKLAMSILIEKYPKEKEEVLSELLRSNNYSLHNTLALLKLINEREQVQEQDMANDVKHEFDDCDGSSVFEESETLQSSYERSREEARTHFLKRNEYFQKAQHEYTSGNKAAASFYSQLANMHMKKMEDANCKAATLLLSTSHSTKNTLDLHFYQVKEAVQVLDLFLDASITRLEESRKPKLKIFIITGRGLHSVNRRSVMKPVVMKKLQQRNIRYHEDEANPGAIICTLTRRS